MKDQQVYQTLKIVFLTLIINMSYAQTIVWNGLGDGITWDDGANWVGGNVPDQNNVVEIEGDSVIAMDKVAIKQLKLLAGGILVHKSPGDGIFFIEESVADGITIDGFAKLYVEGIMEVHKSNNNGILIEANGGLFIKPDRTLTIKETLEDGIKGVVGGTFYNEGNITISEYATDGIDVVSFYNKGKIFIIDQGITGLKVSGSNAINNGVIEVHDDIIIQSTGLFTNKEDGHITSHSSLSIGSNFLNQGDIITNNSSGTSLEISANKTFTNEKTVQLRISSGTNLKLSGGSDFINELDASIILTSNSIAVSAGAYTMELIGVDSKFTNHGLANFNIRGKKEGIFIGARSLIENDGLFYLTNYYEKGIVTNIATFNTPAISNNEKGYFKVEGGKLPSASSLTLSQRNLVINSICANLILRDSVNLTGYGVNLKNSGYLELPKFYKNSQAVFENVGALYLSDSALAFNVPTGYISQVTNTGLIYHAHEAPIVSGVPVTSFFEAINAPNVEIVGNQIQVLNSGLYANAGTVNIGTNTWLPPVIAAAEDSVYFNYKKPGASCDTRRLIMPFITPTLSLDCSSTPTIEVTFTGAVSQAWNIAGNWSNNAVPRPCDNVTIPNGKKVVIGSGQSVLINKIHVVTGAVLDAANGSVLEANIDY